jgi:hypothetical protein
MRAALLSILLLCPSTEALALQGGLVRERERIRALYQPHRGEALGAISGEVPTAIRILPPGGPEAWPEAARARLAARVRAAWRPGSPLGAVRPGVGIWVRYPLVAAKQGDQVLVPVVEEAELPLRGSVALPRSTGPRRVVVLLDASSSANAPILFADAGGRARQIPALEAERRAIRQLLEVLDRERVELGVIAFGEETRAIVEPGASVEAARERLDAFRRDYPRGEGRTDTVCALWLARDWLDEAPDGYAREIVLLTDGDFPHSGRFQRCERQRGEQARAACEARRNTTECPSTHRFRAADGGSDLVQMSSLARRLRRRLQVHALVFGSERGARPYRELAEQTGGELVRVASAEAIEAALPALVARRIRAVVATNLDTGEVAEELYDADAAGFDGQLGLRPGPNDIELRILGDRGTAGLFRYRVWHEPRFLQDYLAELRGRNRDLGQRLGDLVERSRSEPQPHPRRLEVEPESAPAAGRD